MDNKKKIPHIALGAWAWGAGAAGGDQVFGNHLQIASDGAWRSIYQYVFALANGGGKEGFFYNDWAKEPGVAISCCNDGFRPVVFKIEATDEESIKDF